MGRKADFLVIGAGVVGLSIARSLASAGKVVLVVDAGDYGTGASGANLGQTSVSDRDAGLEHDLVLESLDEYESMQTERDIEFLREGGLFTFDTKKELDIAEPLVREKQAAGFTVELLTGREVKKQEPCIEHVAGAVYSPDEGRINPFRVCSFFYEEAAAAGCSFKSYCTIENFIVEAGEVRGAVSNKGEIFRAGVTILATGSWTRELCRSLGLDVPVDYVRGSAMVTRPMPKLLNGPVVGEFFLDEESAGEPAEKTMRGGNEIFFGCVQEAAGGIVISQANRIVEDYDTSVDYEGICGMADKFLTHFPAVRDVSLVRAWSGVTTVSRLDRGIWGFSGVFPGLFFAVAFKGAFSLAPAVGRYSASMLTGGSVREEIAAWGPGSCGI